MTARQCKVVIQSRDRGGAAAALPFDPKEAFGKARAPVLVTAYRELASALAGAPDAMQVFHSLSYSHRNEYARSVREAKREATRIDRAGKSVQRLRSGE
jgi:hypothetical protein